jgi:hypothetical protein
LRRLLTLSALSLLLASPARADALTDLRAALEALRGSAPLAASATIRIASTTEDDDVERKEEGEVTVDIEDGSGGLSIRYPKALLDRLEREAKATRADPEKTAPARSAVREIDSILASSLLNHAPALLGRLEAAELVEQKSVALDGAPARLLVFRVTPRMSASAKKRIKSAEVLLRVWAGPDGLPRAAELTEKIHAKILIMSFHHDGKSSWTFERASDRLLVRSYRDENSDRGFGQNSRRTVEVKLTPSTP